MTQPAPSDLQTNEMAEMKSILSELMELKRDARAAEEKRTAAEAEMVEREKTIRQGRYKVSQQDGAGRDTWSENEYEEEGDMDEDDYNPYEEDDEDPVTSISMNDHLIALKLCISSQEETTPLPTTAQPASFSTFRAPALPKPGPEEAVAMPTTTVAMAAKLKQRQEFKLEKGLQEGALLTQLEEYYKKVKKPVAI